MGKPHIKKLKILGARWLTRNKVHTEDKQTVDATAQSQLSVKAPGTCPLLDIFFTFLSNTLPQNSVSFRKMAKHIFFM